MNLQKQIILIAEDDPATAGQIQAALGEAYILNFSGSLLDLFGLNPAVQPDLLVVDTCPAGGDPDPDPVWEQICAQLNQNPRTRLIPVLRIVDAENELDGAGRPAGGLDFISRPLRAAVLRARAATLLELKGLREQVGRMAATDQVTGLFTQPFFDEVLNREWRRALRYQTPQSLMLLTVDFLEDFQVHYGEIAALECLRRIANLLVQSAQRETDCVARYGAGEFVILLPETDPSGALQVAQHIQDALEEMNIAHAYSPAAERVTLSIGLATLRPKPKQTPAQLLLKASALLNDAKRQGFNRIRYIIEG